MTIHDTKFKPLLADTLEGENADQIQYPVLASAKLDGIRAIVCGGTVWSRNLKPIPNQSVQTLIGQEALTGLDGELIVGSPCDPKCYRNTSSGIMSQDGHPEFKFYVFDTVPELTGFDPREFSWRYEKIKEWMDDHRESYGHLVEIVPHELIESADHLIEFEQKCLAVGFEGIMIRSLSGKYKYGRSTLKEGILLKLKRFMQTEATVVGFAERMHNGNEATKDALGRTERSSHKENLVGRGDLGALEVVMASSPETSVRFTIGTGFDDTLRTEIWNNKEKYLNKTVTFKYFAVGDYSAPRFPVFVGFREDV